MQGAVGASLGLDVVWIGFTVVSAGLDVGLVVDSIEGSMIGLYVP